VCKDQEVKLVVFGTDKETEDRTWYSDWGTDWRMRGLTADRVNELFLFQNVQRVTENNRALYITPKEVHFSR